MEKIELPSELASLQGSIDFKTGADVESYRHDPRDRFQGAQIPVFLPRSTAEVAVLVKACGKAGIGIIPVSGGTGVVAGQLAISPDKVIAVSMERLNAIRGLSLADGVIVAEAGCILADLQNAAEVADRLFPLGMASEGSCRLGGNLATNCGGIQVLRYGNARDLCLGIEAVLPDGSILSELSPLRKNNTGYDLRHLLIGSEGTLGIITAAAMVIKPRDSQTITAFCSIASPEAAISLLDTMRNQGALNVSAFEIMSDYGISVLEKHFPSERFPLESRSSWYALIEIGGDGSIENKAQTFLANAIESGRIDNAALAASDAQRQALWRLREITPEANRLEGAICSSDTAVPLSRIGEFIETTYRAVAEIDPGLTINCYGHIGDGNIHFNIFPPPGTNKAEMIERDLETIEAIRIAIDETTIACHGAISAEHGIGRLKVGDLEHFASPAKLAALRAIKRALDPHGIMNPGALLRNIRQT